MKFGDLSNISAPIFAIRLEDFLIKFENESLIEKAFYFGNRKYFNPKINGEVLQFLHSVFFKTGYTIYLVHSIKLNSKIEEILESIPYNKLLFIENDNTLYYYLNTGFISYYLDKEEIIRDMSTNKALSLSEAYKYI